MQIKGINSECRSDAMREALRLAGYRQCTKKARWPRKKGPAGTRKEIRTGRTVGFVN